MQYPLLLYNSTYRSLKLPPVRIERHLGSPFCFMYQDVRLCYWDMLGATHNGIAAVDHCRMLNGQTGYAALICSPKGRTTCQQLGSSSLNLRIRAGTHISCPFMLFHFISWSFKLYLIYNSTLTSRHSLLTYTGRLARINDNTIIYAIGLVWDQKGSTYSYNQAPYGYLISTQMAHTQLYSCNSSLQ